ncbi:hypothetical protein [Aquimarina sp. I32.4]|uniref:hypothetical protein n=1 Tax=Aquimarina sp. I32.4 TaxID=2053903 RepID=UPI000CDE800B|nr:hypothetical protein [Aquimarina sp. I32.4]
MSLYTKEIPPSIFYKILVIVLVIFQCNHMQAQEKEQIKRDSSYVILENPQDFYEGTYKEEKPYKGYFKQGEDEFFTVDYYEKGIKKYTYSLDVMHMFDGGMESELNVKTTYKNDEIYTGVKLYKAKDRIVTEEYEKGIVIGVYVDIFAVHYYNRIHFKKENDAITIKSFREKDQSIRVFQKNQNVVAELLNNDVILTRVQSVNKDQSVFPIDSDIRMYEEEGIVKGIAYQNFDTSEEVYSKSELMLRIFNQIDVQSTKKQWGIFEQFKNSLISGKDFIEERTYDNSSKIMGYFVTNNDGTIKNGIRFLNDKKEGYYQIFKDSKKIKEEKTNVDTFQEVFEAYVKNTLS